jgi:alkylation response protein AidB-like acyl-CoA dehydrogenase
MSDAQYALTQDQLDFLEVIRQMVVEKVTPRAHDIDESGEFPQDIRELFAEHDLFGLPFEEKHGGTGTGELMLCAAIEEIAKGCASSSLMVAAQDLSSLPMKLAASDELKDRILPRMASGEWLGAFCLSEPDAGSDPGAMRTRATKVDGGWKLNGAKNWITNSGVADVYVTFAVTDPDVKFSRGITCFAVMGDADGFRIDALEKKMGMKGSPTGQPVYEDVFVPDEDVIGEVGKGFAVAMQTLDRSRLGIGAQALGIAQGATDYAADYAKERIAFGKPINQLQGIQFKLADKETKTAAARELLYKAASMAETSHPLLGKYSAMAKLFASDVAMEVTTEAVQVLGGYGYVREYPVERWHRDAKIYDIFEGAEQIQELVIARAISGVRIQ